jgi:hypothetical protein
MLARAGVRCQVQGTQTVGEFPAPRTYLVGHVSHQEVFAMTMLRAMLLPVFALALAGAGGAQALAKSMKDSPEGLALREAAHAECRKPQYAHDTRIVINYAKGWFRCEEPREYDEDGRR